MEDAEEIERFYEKEMDTADRAFLEEIKTTKDKEKLTKDYKERIKKIRQVYSDKYGVYLKNQVKKASLLSKTPVKKKEEKLAHLKVEPLDWRLSKKERLKLQLEQRRFKWRIKRRNFLRKIQPKYFSILSIKFRLFAKRNYYAAKDGIRTFFVNSRDQTIERAKKTRESVKVFFSNIGKAISGFFAWIKKKFVREKKEGKKTEDQKLAEKILAKKD